MSGQITIDNRTYPVRPFVDKLELIAINLQESLLQSLKGYNRIFDGLIQPLRGFSPTETANGVVKGYDREIVPSGQQIEVTKTAQTELVHGYSKAIGYHWIGYWE